MSDSTELEVFCAGLAARTRDIALVLHRLDRLEVGQGRWLGEFLADEAARFQAAQEMVLRALAVVSDPANWELLRELASGETCQLPRLSEVTGLGRFVLTERLNNLGQVGLASWLWETDSAQITPAGLAIFRLVDTCCRKVAAEIAGMLGKLVRTEPQAP